MKYTGLGVEAISTDWPPLAYLMGMPPFSTTVLTPVRV